MWRLSIISLVGCASDFDLRVKVGGITGDAVRFEGRTTQVFDGRVTLDRYFDSYEDGLAAGGMRIEFLENGEVTIVGVVAVGDCLCSAPQCLERDDIVREEQDYYDPAGVAPGSSICFSCFGHEGRMVRACQ